MKDPILVAGTTAPAVIAHYSPEGEASSGEIAAVFQKVVNDNWSLQVGAEEIRAVPNPVPSPSLSSVSRFALKVLLHVAPDWDPRVKPDHRLRLNKTERAFVQQALQSIVDKNTNAVTRGVLRFCGLFTPNDLTRLEAAIRCLHTVDFAKEVEREARPELRQQKPEQRAAALRERLKTKVSLEDVVEYLSIVWKRTLRSVISLDRGALAALDEVLEHSLADFCETIARTPGIDVEKQYRAFLSAVDTKAWALSSPRTEPFTLEEFRELAKDDEAFIRREYTNGRELLAALHDGSWKEGEVKRASTAPIVGIDEYRRLLLQSLEDEEKMIVHLFKAVRSPLPTPPGKTSVRVEQVSRPKQPKQSWIRRLIEKLSYGFRK